MVQEGYLELRVALRVHRETGEPLPFSSSIDGYAHEKWAIFRDAEGNRLVAAGSLNESKTALTLNAENLVVRCDWEGDKDAHFADQVDASFEAIWNDDDPGLRVLTLPDAVRERLIQIAASVTKPKEIDGSSELPPEAPQPSAKEWLQFAILRDAPRMPNGRLVGMVTAPVEPWPHQAVVARRLIESWPYSFLLCDEVGLGKTIEAGSRAALPDPVRTGPPGLDRPAGEPGQAVAQRAEGQVLPALRPRPERCPAASRDHPSDRAPVPEQVGLRAGPGHRLHRAGAPKGAPQGADEPRLGHRPGRRGPLRRAQERDQRHHGATPLRRALSCRRRWPAPEHQGPVAGDGDADAARSHRGLRPVPADPPGRPLLAGPLADRGLLRGPRAHPARRAGLSG